MTILGPIVDLRTVIAKAIYIATGAMDHDEVNWVAASEWSVNAAVNVMAMMSDNPRLVARWLETIEEDPSHPPSPPPFLKPTVE